MQAGLTNNTKTLDTTMKSKLIIAMICVTAMCGCTNKSNGEDLEVMDIEHNNHDYILIENTKSGSISFLHSPDCKCNNKQD